MAMAQTAIEPIFDLVAQLLGSSGEQKPFFRQSIENARTHLGLSVLSLQVAADSYSALAIRVCPACSISSLRGCSASAVTKRMVVVSPFT